MTRREFSAAERQAAEAAAFAEAQRTGHYRQPVPPVDPAELQRIIEAAMACPDPQAAQSRVARELQAAGADSTTVTRAMRRVGEAVTRQATRSGVGNLAASAQAFGDRRAAARLRRLRGPFDGGTAPR
jgi:hypothetical protein